MYSIVDGKINFIYGGEFTLTKDITVLADDTVEYARRIFNGDSTPPQTKTFTSGTKISIGERDEKLVLFNEQQIFYPIETFGVHTTKGLITNKQVLETTEEITIDANVYNSESFEGFELVKNDDRSMLEVLDEHLANIREAFVKIINSDDHDNDSDFDDIFEDALHNITYTSIDNDDQIQPYYKIPAGTRFELDGNGLRYNGKHAFHFTHLRADTTSKFKIV